MVGGFVTALGVTAYYVPATLFGVPPLLANLLGYCVAVLFGYVLHSRVSFRGHGSRDRSAARTIRFFTVNVLGFLSNQLSIWLLVKQLDGPTWWPIPFIIFVTPILTFTLNRKWVFA